MDNIGASDADLESKAIENIHSRAPAKADDAKPKPPASAVIDEARRALARGADRAKVIARLKSMGIDPQGL
jgi:hypothetical protein